MVVLKIPKPSVDEEYVEQYQITTGDEWYAPIWDFLTQGYLPQDSAQARSIRRQAIRYVKYNGVLFHMGFTRPWQRCLSGQQAQSALREVHKGIRGSHQGARTLAHRILRAGYFWPTLLKDAKDMVKRCATCQFYNN
jgi:Integrase zinc binding domain